MSNVNGNNPPAGWYPDPAGSAQQRWWDGTQWTGYLQGPATPSAPAAAPAQTAPAQPAPAQPMYTNQQAYANAAPIDPRYTTVASLVQPNLGPNPAIYTPFIWIIVLLPLLSTIAFAFFNLNAYVAIGTPSSSSSMASLAMLADPLYLVNALLGWVIYGVSVWIAYLDWRALTRLGVVRPFHWAWTFLGGLVYVVGRSIVVRRRVGTGLLPIWVSIGVVVISIVVAVVKVVSLVNAVMTAVPFS